LDDNEKTFNQLMGLPGAQNIDDLQEAVLKRWVALRTRHNFTTDTRSSAEAKLFAAAVRVAALMLQGDAISKLFTADNLKFITQDNDRKPTLYFKSGEQSGRFRQTHGSGPTINMEEGKTDFFYKNEADWRAFHQKMSNARRNGEEPGFLDWQWALQFHGPGTEETGDYHLEVTRNLNGIVTKTHASGGRYSSNIGRYNNDWINKNILGTLGLIEGIDGL